MSFSSRVKTTLMSNPSSNPCCISAELSAFFAISAKRESEELITFKQKRQDVLEYYSRYMPLNCNQLEGRANIRASLEKIVSLDELESICCQKALLRTAFINCGTMSAPDVSYHLEFATDHIGLTDAIANALFELGLTPKVAARRYASVTYLKSSEQIADLLNALGCHSLMVEFWDARLTREINNEVNRALNCDMHNTDRTVAAAVSQLKMIHDISHKIGLENLPEGLRDACYVRIDNPSLSLSELASQLSISKSAINHRFRKIKEIHSQLSPL